MRKGPQLANSESLCLGGNLVIAWDAVTWCSAGLEALFQVGSLSWLWGRPQHLTTWASLQLARETASFFRGQWPQTGRRKPPQQAWICHTVTSVMCNHEKLSLKSCTLSSEDSSFNIWREVEGVVDFPKTITYRKTSGQLNTVFSGAASF